MGEDLTGTPIKPDTYLKPSWEELCDAADRQIKADKERMFWTPEERQQRAGEFSI